MTKISEVSRPGQQESSRGHSAGSMGPRPGEIEIEIDLRRYGLLLWAGRWVVLGVALICALTALAWSLTRTKTFRTTTTVAIEAGGPQVIESQMSFGPTFWELERHIKEQVRVLRSYSLGEKAAGRMADLPNPPSSGQLLGALDVEVVRETSILNISMIGADPEQITEWLNEYIETFIDANIEQSLERTDQIRRVILKKLKPLEEEMHVKEQELNAYLRRSDSLLSGDQDKNVIREQVSRLTSDYAEAKTTRIDLEARIAALEGLRSASNLESFPDVVRDSTVQELRRELNRLDLDLVEKLRTYREGHPTIVNLKSRITEIKRQITRQVSSIVAALRTDFQIRQGQEKALYASLEELKDKRIELERQELQREALRRQYETTKGFYEQMIDRSKEADISGAVALNNIRVIDRARVPGSHFAPKTSRNTGLGLVVGLLLGIAVVLLIDSMDSTIRTPDDLENDFNLDVLGVVPIYAEGKTEVIREIYQSLRTAMLFAARDSGPQMIMVTSAGPSEGKTTTSFNLAKVLAAAGAKVLLIDADLRRPAIHRTAGSGNEVGLTSVLLNETELENAVVTLASAKNLDILTSGPLPPNPPELFGRRSFHQLVKHCKESYDWIVIDTPPVGSVTDAVVCSRFADMVLLVVRYAQFDRKMIRSALRQLSWAGARVVGALLNRVDVERDHYYYDSYYTNYYHYAYTNKDQPNDDDAKPKRRRRSGTA